MSARSIAVRKLLAEARGALTFGRAHVVVIADREIARQLPEMLGEKLRGEMDAVTVRLVGQHDSVADCVAAAIRNARLAALQGDLSSVPARATPVPSQKAPLVLLLPDALAIPPASLRSLHEITSRLGAHRLVLLVDRDVTTVDDPALELGARLGAGVTKIELDLAAAGAPPPPGSVREPVATLAGAGDQRPARVEPTSRPPASPPEPARNTRGRRRLRGLATAVLVFGAVLATPGIVEHAVEPAWRSEAGVAALVPDPERTGGDPAEQRADAGGSEREAPAAAAPAAGAALGPGPAPAPRPSSTGVPSSDGPRAEAAPRPLAPDPPPRKPAPPPVRVGVNFNAVPWAELEIDGRRVGPTPIANLPLTEGTHEVRATFPNGRVVRESIRVDARRRRFQIRQL